MSDVRIKAKGFIVTFGKRVFGGYFNKRSPGLTFAKPLLNRHILFSVVPIYDRQNRFTVQISSNTNPVLNKKFGTIFIRKRFPYASFSCDFVDYYKAFHIKIAWIKCDDDYTLSIKNKQTGNVQEICDVMFLDKSNGGQSQKILSGMELSELSKIRYEDAKELARAALSSAANNKSDKAKTDLMKIFAALRVNHRFIRKGLQALATKAEHNPSQLDDLAEDINNLIDPFILGPHGYNRRLSSISNKKLHSAISRLVSFVEDNGAKIFLNSGTLLGARRSGDMLPHDDDLDFAIYISGATENEIAKGWNEIRQKFYENFKIIEKGAFFAIDILDGTEIDLFPAWSIDGKVYIFPYCTGEIKDESLLPLGEVLLRDHLYPAPRKIDSVLEVNYGPNWHSPDPYWKFDWNSARANFKRIKLLFEETR
ncbi:MAG: LicD family protein [Rhodobacteraceae bacterium]|nr:LicD family protein [Paracoccaceae bacterium]